MASEPVASSETRRNVSFFVPFFLDFTNSSPRTDPHPENDQPENPTRRDRILLVNPFTQAMVMIDSASSLESLLRNTAAEKNGPPPASRASIAAMPSVEIKEGEEGECVVCLEEWRLGGVVKEMPCKHRFHGDCVEKWLRIHGSCPVCRHKMPVEEDEVGKKRDHERDIWVSLGFNGGRRSGDSNSNQTALGDSMDSSPRPDDDHQMEG